MTFSVGDVVRLKSGSEKMTVRDLDSGVVDCVWFDKNGAMAYGGFPSATLELDSEFQQRRAAALASVGNRMAR